ncbi:hypothetical protein M011DRAFT_72460 [Sporormia fimetaria CBS 119925]|uniref:Metalloendopeptidase n=1 Tax=Sporormia fimetaria CBS 119925 TaxID=1340428 RepID=A0A6A6VB66_9PLEO|nr:hypothetical protein M011DRAFT_72460 [Sporormia fimetaria CBS 119925]
MRVFLLLFTGFAALLSVASGCPPPFNNFDFLGNSTEDTAAIIDAAFRAGELDKYLEPTMDSQAGWHDAVSKRGSITKPWPKSPSNGKPAPIVELPFCLRDPYAEVHAKYVLETALQVWRVNGLGEPGPHSGHRLQWTFADPGTYCRHPDGNWNKAVHGHTIEVLINPAISGGAASLGFTPPAWDSRPGRHQLALGEDVWKLPLFEALPVVAHEIGHLFGLTHEHQRPDRDHYVKFMCHNLVGYEAVKREVENNPKRNGDTIEKICEDCSVAWLYDSP